jgi:hypothetical protein
MRAVAEWPDGDPENQIHGLTYAQYKAAWFHAFLWKSRFEFFYTQLRFAHMFREFEEPDWLQEWWESFGLHPLGVNPQVSETVSMFEPWHRTLELSVIFILRKNSEKFYSRKTSMGAQNQIHVGRRRTRY